ncbi:hypothetical protein JCM17844_07120 [Iodidimonas gelatinilytica]|uniref:Bacteriophage phiJL001 Gp84 C-terminal domain-containing protein n=1 Tax=Iodidimonas gelatinilytica TaxID=1236966 RepID=A0A5A7MQ34_9PROT|nr:DUF2163 domain-containing protein [Iodidimonas gelatinilytica]GEQ97075.1 hypothetical protein JCM17844_07120 [Iodidimonas gelatinilytica]GEQ99409.1 hypothetical protein JCM17845_00330 [Iodidimonas gelatinilytica]
MRQITPQLQTHLAQQVTSLATCWRLQRRDGVLVALTSHDRDLMVGGVRYHADGGLSATAARDTADLATDNLEIEGVLESTNLVPDDLSSGRFDGARVTVFMVDWNNPDAGQLLVKQGTLGRITRIDGGFRAEVRGLTHALSQSITEQYSPGCRAELGDRRCKKSLNAFRRTASVQTVIDETVFVVDFSGDPDGWYDFGKLRWHLGGNGGLVSEVRRFEMGRLTLFQAPPRPMAVGDVFTLTAGCDKTLAVCREKFDNVSNFRGDPFVPGIDALLDYPGFQ